MKAFEFQHAGEIIFGNGRISEVGSVVSRYGRRCLIVSGPRRGALRDLYPIVGDLLEHLGLHWEHFDGVAPNPTVELVSTGSKLAKKFEADVILGIGGGSSLDAAKAIFRQRPKELLFPLAQKRDVGILVRLPLASGLLGGKITRETQFAPDDHRRYNRYGEQFDRGETFSGVDLDVALDAVSQIRRIMSADVSMADFAMR